MITTAKRIPYGISDYKRMRHENAYYVDKTEYIPWLEAAPFYLFCIRPRRFGKSLWLSLLLHYYDVSQAEQFETLFGGTHIGQNPTSDRNSYLMLYFNFSLVNPAMDKVEASFEGVCGDEIASFLRRYERFFTAAQLQDIRAAENVTAKLRRICYYAVEQEVKVYLLIDEYDNFANTILSTYGQTRYHDLTHGAGFFRHFFNMLKGATTGQMAGLSRMFMTGVSPMTMDDVTSGFNIGHNISLDSLFNGMIGFTEPEVLAMLEHYHAADWLRLPISDTLGVMKQWYNNYHFGEDADTPMFNSDMVLYFLLAARQRTKLPRYLIDPNVRIDYTKLRHLMAVDHRLNGNFSLLKTVVEDGEIASPIIPSFPLEHLLRRENFVSLLYYFGLLTIAGEEEGQSLLCIPNHTIKDLMYGYIREGYADVGVFKLDVWRLSNLLSKMAYRGQWRPFFDYLSTQIQQQASIRDHLSAKKVIQGFLIAYLNVTHDFLTWSEREMGGGFADLYLEPSLVRYPDIKYGYLIELEYISNRTLNQKDFDRTLSKEKQEATDQLRQYSADPRIQQVAEQVTLKKLVLIYKGWELIYAGEVV